jgi:hypothetical protein
MQTTVAEYVADKFAVTLVLPTPASVNPLQVTEPLELTEQLAVPDLKCVPEGAFAGFVVVVCVAPAAAGNATAAVSTIPRAKRRSFVMD